VTDSIDDLRAQLGPAPAAHTNDDAVFDFSMLQASIEQDLDDKQGPWRKSSALSRYWPNALAVLFALGVMFVKPMTAPETTWLWVASIMGALSVIVCAVAVGMGPSRPGRAETLSKLGLTLAVLSLVFEGIVGIASSQEGLGKIGHCTASLFAFSVPPLVLLGVMAWRAKAPLRKLHGLALATSAMAVGGVTVWRHCAHDGLVHVMVSHVAPMALGMGIGGMVLFKLLQPKKVQWTTPN